jgi:dCMP deaminase
MIPNWTEYFMSMVDLVATRSSCLRRQVGAVLVRDKRVLTTGYNGPPSGIRQCTQDTCIRISGNVPSGHRLDLCPAVHAEQNTIIQAAYTGVSVVGSTMYTQGLPCSQCTKMILNSGISNIVVSRADYDDPLAKRLYEARPDVSLWLYTLNTGNIHQFTIVEGCFKLV